MEKQLLTDIIEWDLVNWGKAIPYWEDRLPNSKGKALELGGRRGGLSLWIALKGFEVVCSDLENPEETAKPLHQKYKDLKINYASIDATNIPYEESFDVVIFKSILGGIGRNGQDEKKKLVIDQAYRSLKKGGVLLFAENLESSLVHRFFRKNFVKWGSEWNYLRMEEVHSIFSEFSKVEYKTTGFFAAFGRSESQRGFLGKIDHLISGILSSKQHYVIYGVAYK